MFTLVQDLCTRSPLYGIMLRKSVHDLRELHQDTWPAVVHNTRSLSAGLYHAGGSTLTIAEMLKSLANPKLDTITVSLNTFDFVRDLYAIGDNNSRRLARQCISHWIDCNNNWSKKPWRSPSWNLDILGYRLCNWFGFYDFFAHSADQEFRKRLLVSIGQQYRFLKHRHSSIKDPISHFRALKGLIYAGCALPQEQNKLSKWLDNLYICLKEQFDDRFNHKSRHPGTVVLLLRDLIDLRLLLRHFYAGQIDSINDCIVRLAPIVRHLRHSDGELSSFTGNATQRLEAFCDPVLGNVFVDMTLSLADSRASLLDNVAMGYVRCFSKNGFLLINTQSTTSYTKLNDWYTKSTGILDFEWSELAQRLLTRGDVSVYAVESNCFVKYKSKKNESIKNKIIHEKGHGLFSGDYQATHHPNKTDPYGIVLQVKRELYISPNHEIRGEDVFLMSQVGIAYVRFLAAPGLEWRIKGESAFLCKAGKLKKPEKIKRFLCHGVTINLSIVNILGQQALCAEIPITINAPVTLKWAISSIS